jgi:pimeloyl-ACP methyl ester carboxylesterase
VENMECKIKDVSINYEIIGSGRPIVMLHGYYVDHRIMAGCMEPIFSDKEGYKRIYLDLPGMGKSGSAEWIMSSDALIDIIIAFIEKIIPNENFLIAGQSYGGYLVRGVMNKMTDRVDGAILICPVIIADNKKRSVEEQVLLVKDKELLSRLTPEEAEDFSTSVVIQSEKIYDRYKNELLAGISLADDKFLQDLRRQGYEFSFEVDKIDKKFQNPMLILLGKQDDCVGYKDAWNILENFPRATFAVLDVAGHSLQIEQEELFNSLVNDFLIRVSR